MRKTLATCAFGIILGLTSCDNNTPLNTNNTSSDNIVQVQNSYVPENTRQEGLDFAQARIYQGRALNEVYRPDGDLNLAINYAEDAVGLLNPKISRHEDQLRLIYGLMIQMYEVTEQKDKADSTQKLLRQLSE